MREVKLFSVSHDELYFSSKPSKTSFCPNSPIESEVEYFIKMSRKFILRNLFLLLKKAYDPEAQGGGVSLLTYLDLVTA